MKLIDADSLADKLRYMGYMDDNEELQELIDRFPEENEDNLDWLPFEEYDSISTSDERAEILNTITEAIENKNFWVAGYDDTDGVFLKVLLMKGDKE